MQADEAIRVGLVSRVFENKDTMVAEALKVAQEIATKSPVAIAGTKFNLNYSRGRPVADTLEFMATWNAAMLQTEDIGSAAVASLKKQDQPEFSKL
jgi:Delta3,5-Delta2,4-dienoyl-CoA isomerase